MKCENCKKGVMYGHNVSHSKRRTRRIFKPNLHKARVEVSGSHKRMKLCSKCIRLFKRTGKEKASRESVVLENIHLQSPTAA